MRWLTTALFASTLVACGADAPSPAGAWHAVTELTPSGTLQLTRAEASREALFAALVATLTEEIQERGAASAITVCKERAPQLAARVAADRGVSIGRTSWKLRNPDNRGPEWVRDAMVGRPESPLYFEDDRGRFGLLTPIRLQEPCLNCHGSEDRLAPGVRERLAELYPDDAATGFAAGDLRGWFWVEVPAS
ncbi:MAG: DUF3365 domain-containing protein [Planctomycetes bacterium]|nr:DUF3365 domain-containing protein [Planctomycetota bacterium]